MAGYTATCSFPGCDKTAIWTRKEGWIVAPGSPPGDVCETHHCWEPITEKAEIIPTNIDILFEWSDGSLDKQTTVKGFLRRSSDNSLEINLGQEVKIEPKQVDRLLNIHFHPVAWPDDANVIMEFKRPMYEGDVITIQPSVVLSF